MNRAWLDGFRSRSGRLSYWRIPNGLFEPRGLFLGRRDPLLDRLNAVRGVVGVLLLVGVSVRYQHLVTTSTKSTSHGVVRVFRVNDPSERWLEPLPPEHLSNLPETIQTGTD